MNVRPSRASRSVVVVRRPVHRPGLVHVRLTDDHAVPDVDELRAVVEVLVADPSVERIRTSALLPRPAERFATVGFGVADTLALLRADLTAPGLPSSLTGRAHLDLRRSRSLRAGQFAAAARIDAAAFGPEWGHGPDEIGEICRATPIHRARLRCDGESRSWRHGRRHGEPVAFAISGASSDHGYLQRLSVDPAHQRHGHGRALTADALGWMARRRLPDCLVNTSISNEAALALYDSIGFVILPDRLRVLEQVVQH